MPTPQRQLLLSETGTKSANVQRGGGKDIYEVAKTPEATFPEIQTLMAPGREGKMDQNRRLRRLWAEGRSVSYPSSPWVIYLNDPLRCRQ